MLYLLAQKNKNFRELETRRTGKHDMILEQFYVECNFETNPLVKKRTKANGINCKCNE